MLLFKKILTVFLFCSLVLINACGFKPIYASKSNGVDVTYEISQININNIPNRSGQKLRNLLMDRMYPIARPSNSRYMLNISPVKETQRSLGIKKDASATRAQIVITTNLKLIDKQSGETVMSRDLKSTNSFNILDSQYTTMVTEEDARQRALVQISDEVMTHLSLYFNR